MLIAIAVHTSPSYKMIAKTTLVLFFYFLCNYTWALQCLDDNNQPVDWLIAYKLPLIKDGGRFIGDGTAYVYITSKDYSGWKLSNNSISSGKSFLGNTLVHLYDRRDDNMFILYNDEPPNTPSSNKGHTKGVVMVNQDGGFWLVHSVPKFPLADQSYKYPDTGKTYGQSFICLSMNLQNLNVVGLQLQYNEPDIYDKHILPTLSSHLPDLVKAANNFVNERSPWYHVSNLQTVSGASFISFAKDRNFRKDLYEDLLAPTLKADLLVETWPNGSGRMRSNCSHIFKVNNVESVYLSAANVSFKSTHDHSKWAVSSPTNENAWICIGDINRAEHQTLRGGGTVCFKNKNIAKIYQKSVHSIENC